MSERQRSTQEWEMLCLVGHSIEVIYHENVKSMYSGTNPLH